MNEQKQTPKTKLLVCDLWNRFKQIIRSRETMTLAQWKQLESHKSPQSMRSSDPHKELR